MIIAKTFQLSKIKAQKAKVKIRTHGDDATSSIHLGVQGLGSGIFNACYI